MGTAAVVPCSLVFLMSCCSGFLMVVSYGLLWWLVGGCLLCAAPVVAFMWVLVLASSRMKFCHVWGM